MALPHLARVVTSDRSGPRNEQGEREAIESTGPWFPARRTTATRPSKDPADHGGHARVERRLNLLYGDSYDDGSPLTRPPGPSDLVDVQRDGQIARYVVGPPKEIDTGTSVIGGQVELVEVTDASA